MKTLFDIVSHKCSEVVTTSYSTSFSSAVKMLAPSIRQDIYNIYGFVRFADEIVDSFNNYDQLDLLNKFEIELKEALIYKISLNPILNSFQETFHKYEIPLDLVDAFMKSMRQDLTKKNYLSKKEYEEYIYGSADVVGLMCLKVFTKGNNDMYEMLKKPAMKLGSAFQKVNFLRDLKADFEILERTYFPNTDLNNLNDISKMEIIEEIEQDLRMGFEGIKQLPIEAKFGVYTAYIYYKKLLIKLKQIPSSQIKTRRVRVPDYQKIGLIANCYVKYRLNLL